jgi:hypothetical protein
VETPFCAYIRYPFFGKSVREFIGMKKTFEDAIGDEIGIDNIG